MLPRDGAMSCKRSLCPYSHNDGPRSHGFCCSACKRNEPNNHTHNCSGFTTQCRRSSKVASDESFKNLPSFILPVRWVREEEGVARYMSWYLWKFDVQYDQGAEGKWHDFAVDASYLTQWSGNRRPLRLYAFAENKLPSFFADQSINVAIRGVSALSLHYTMAEVSGVHWEVQAAVAVQEMTPTVLLEAMHVIETGNLSHFAFVCQGGTHRSVACCILLAALVYSDAQIVLTTHRTRRDASDRGLCTVY